MLVGAYWTTSIGREGPTKRMKHIWSRGMIEAEMEVNANVTRKNGAAPRIRWSKFLGVLLGERKEEMEKIQKMFKKAKQQGDDKVSIAIQTYEMVDKHIRRLDSDLVSSESLLKVERAWPRARRPGLNFCLAVNKPQALGWTSLNIRKARSRL